MSTPAPICDYEGSDYRTRFWEGQRRDYEDRVERIALRRLLPASGDTILDIGAGYGRLADEFSGYARVALFDYSRSLLLEARQRLGDDPRFVYIAGDWYRMPFVSGLFDTLVQVRTIHHAANVPGLFDQLARIIKPGGAYILEFANKQNLKAILRYWSGGQKWSPFSPHPVEFAELNYDFHPRWMRRNLESKGFIPKKTLAVSTFRLTLLKRIFPTSILARLDGLIQPMGEWIQLSPSVFTFATGPAGVETAAEGAFFACPICQRPLGDPVANLLVCPNTDCQHEWSFQDNIYDFRTGLQ